MYTTIGWKLHTIDNTETEDGARVKFGHEHFFFSPSLIMHFRCALRNNPPPCHNQQEREDFSFICNGVQQRVHEYRAVCVSWEANEGHEWDAVCKRLIVKVCATAYSCQWFPPLSVVFKWKIEDEALLCVCVCDRANNNARKAKQNWTSKHFCSLFVLIYVHYLFYDMF